MSVFKEGSVGYLHINEFKAAIHWQTATSTP